MDYSEYANLPAGTPPQGVVANFDNNSPSRAHELYIWSSICITVAAILLALRMYAKLVVMHSPGWDDCKNYHLIILRMLTAVVACSIGFVRDDSLSTSSWLLRLDSGSFCRPKCCVIYL